MFTISDQAFGTFADSSEDQFVRKLAAFLMESVPSLADVQLDMHLATTRQVLWAARSHGFVNEPEVARYALCAALLGLDFTTNFEGAKEILEIDESPAYRARLLEYFTRELFELLES